MIKSFGVSGKKFRDLFATPMKLAVRGGFLNYAYAMVLEIVALGFEPTSMRYLFQ